jgi:ABC-type Mn2+/Zn2+ transport system permease subunit
LIIGVCVAIFSMITGLIGSYVFNIPSGPSIVLTNTIVFVCFYTIGKLIKR